MTPPALPGMLTVAQAAGFLQRFMPRRNAQQWLENDRHYSPLLPYIVQGDEILYDEAAVARFVTVLVENAAVRHSQRRRVPGERRRIAVDRRAFSDRRHARRRPQLSQLSAQDLDRRFALRQDRRSDLDRRIRGWVDRRCVEERRGIAVDATAPLLAQRPATLHRAARER